ncbi:MAG TPA: ribosomal protein S18-alanine N-acetyltransferase [Aggregatilinea sp.]|jgi:ribosomal-protein-alanine N-acetyltransferase|uniref:ribosomal protein S18-alanine N-acetyltransferase n=1 Tax=Aggregatilinea sp. TaxID=2806333 RepID=UPI002D1842A2|nr:ribosomal protein S18-alanine N-acetyltransferase [Aggregatilinea sp.]HML20394.1 ribosomal protein S18-alanine N-acetyltransferase [Aggregatilinea sp.]
MSSVAYTLRHMRVEDIPQVVDIDRASFSSPWPQRTYEFEITNRDASHFCVIEVADHLDKPRMVRSLFQRFWTPKSVPLIAGYGGCWLIAGEAHISTIAVHPEYRGQGLGELLLSGMLKRSLNLRGQYSVLEVRVSNLSAQQLYRKYEYEVVGRRRGYYRDDGEDALLMEARPLDNGYGERLDDRVKKLHQRVSFADQFTAVESTVE